MKNLFILVGIVVLYLPACKFKYKPYELTIAPDNVTMIYGREMSVNLLDSIATVLQNEDISVSHTDLKYDGDVLSGITIKVDFQGKTGVASTRFVNKGYGFGFKVDKSRGNLTVGDIKH